MNAIIRNVRDIEPSERHVIENILGRELAEGQQVAIQVLAPDVGASGNEAPSESQLPDWCDVYEGLSEEEIAEVEGLILQRANLTRHFE